MHLNAKHDSSSKTFKPGHDGPSQFESTPIIRLLDSTEKADSKTSSELRPNAICQNFPGHL